MQRRPRAESRQPWRRQRVDAREQAVSTRRPRGIDQPRIAARKQGLRPCRQMFKYGKHVGVERLWQATRLHMEVGMPRPVEALAEEVLRLAPEVRAKLLDRVVASLDADRARDAAWDALAAARDADFDSGLVAGIPVGEAIARLRAELK